jgi:hypothetical protein
MLTGLNRLTKFARPGSCRQINYPWGSKKCGGISRQAERAVTFQEGFEQWNFQSFSQLVVIIKE